jgi:hypothetical protein
MPSQDAGRAPDATARMMVGVSLGGSFPQGVPAPGALLDAARHAEASGFDAVWSGDHVMMYSPIVECVTLLAAMAAVTTRVRLGTAVYLLPLRHPVIVAKTFAGLDYVSDGRLVFDGHAVVVVRAQSKAAARDGSIACARASAM